MAKLLRRVGSTSHIIQVFVPDTSSTIGAGLAGLTNATSGLTAYFMRNTDSSSTSISVVSMTLGTYTSGGFKEMDPTHMKGCYQFCPPDAAYISGASNVIFYLQGAANMAPVVVEIDLDAQVDLYTYRGTAIPAPATAGIPDINVLNIGNVTQPPFNQTGGLLTNIRAVTAQAGTSTTITLDSGASTVDDFYAGAGLRVLTGTGTGQSNAIASYAGATRVATMGANWAVVPDNTSLPAILPLGIRAATNYATTADVSSIITEIDSQSNTIQGLVNGVAADLPVTVTINTPLPGFPFFLVSNVDHVTGAVGQTVTAIRYQNGALTSTPCDNAVVEATGGWYVIDLTANDLNAATIGFEFTASGADPRPITILTQP